MISRHFLLHHRVCPFTFLCGTKLAVPLPPGHIRTLLRAKRCYCLRLKCGLCCSIDHTSVTLSFAQQKIAHPSHNHIKIQLWLRGSVLRTHKYFLKLSSFGKPLIKPSSRSAIKIHQTEHTEMTSLLTETR